MTEAAPLPEKPAPGPKGDRLLKAVYVAAGILAVLGVLWLWRSSRMVAEHRKVLEQARQALDGIRVAEIQPEENAAPLYDQALARLASRPEEIGQFWRRLEAFETEIGSEDTAKLLAANGDALKTLAEATAKPKCAFVTDYSAGWSIRLPHSFAQLGGVRLLTVAARRAAGDGRFPEAAQHLRQALHLCRGMGQPRLLMTHLMSISAQESALTGLRDILTATEPDAAWLQATLGVLEEHSLKRHTYREAVRVERLVNMYAAAQVAAGEENTSGIPTGLGFSLYRASGRMIEDARTMDALWDDMEASAGKAYHELSRSSEARPGESSARQRRIDSVRIPYSVVLPSVLAARESDTDGLVLLRCARLAVAARLFKFKSGRLPGELRELAEYFPKDFAEVSTDPASGKPMRYKVTEAGFVVYGVGARDLKDDGAPRPYRDARNPDVTFAVDAKLREAYRAETLSKPKPLKSPGALRPPPPPRPVK